MEKLHITVKVMPKAKKAGLEKVGPAAFRVRVQAAPEKGAANREVVSLLAAHFRIPPSQVEIVRGAKSRIKLVSVARRERHPKTKKG